MLNEPSEKHRQFHQQRRKQHFEILEKKRQRVLGETEKIVQILIKNGATKAFFLGSILNSKNFHQKSDLDILVYNLPLSRWLPTLSEIEEISNLSDIEIDLKRADELSESFLAYTNKHSKHIL